MFEPSIDYGDGGPHPSRVVAAAVVGLDPGRRHSWVRPVARVQIVDTLKQVVELAVVEQEGVIVREGRG